MLLFDIATIRSRTFPTAAAVLLLLGSIAGSRQSAVMADSGDLTG